MISRTPQEWANFLRMKVACFFSGDQCAYYAIDERYSPFSRKWIELLDISNSMEPNDFYKKFMWEMTKDLSNRKYDSVFIPVENGGIKLLKTVGGNKVFELGRLENLQEFFKLPIHISEWDKNVYYPVYDQQANQNQNVEQSEIEEDNINEIFI